MVRGGVSADHFSLSAYHSRPGEAVASAGWTVVPGGVSGAGREKVLTTGGTGVHRGTQLELELLVEWLGSSAMRFSVALICALVLTAVCVFSQDSPSDSKSPVASRPAVLV